jgi:hypothetical protein
MKSQRARPTVALLVLAFVFAVVPGISGQQLQDLQVMGSGTVETNCLISLAPLCTITTRGTATATVTGTQILDGTFLIRVDLGGPASLNGWPAGPGPVGVQQGVCLAATYGGTLTAANGDVLNFTNVGTVCEEAAPGSPYHFNGTFRITAGTGQFAGASGAGSVAVTCTREGATTIVKMSGAIKFGI